MKKFAILGAAALALSTMSAVAQSTWHGLKFGMNRAEVTSALGDYMLVPTSGNKGLESTLDYSLKIESTQFPFKIKVQFDSSDKLSLIVLELDSQAMVQSDNYKNKDMAISVAADVLDNSFIAKYARPTKMDNDCKDGAIAYGDWMAFKQPGFCEKSWSVAQQEVTLFWSMGVPGGTDILAIEYEALADI